MLVRVHTPARLHLGFFDLNGTLGRQFGSIGLSIDGHYTNVEAFFSDSVEHQIPDHLTDKVLELLALFQRSFESQIDIKKPVSIRITNSARRHSGLGSGTQLALAIGTALTRLYALSLSTAEIASLLKRGNRSGIGIAAFEHGGFIVDGGVNHMTKVPPPILARHPYPENWRIVLILEHHHQGVHSGAELTAFDSLPHFPVSSAKTICHLTLMKLLPALVEHDGSHFGQSITEIQALIGDHFSPIQGGRYSSAVVGSLLYKAKSLGFDGIAQSSWGPTGCVFVDNEQTAMQLVSELNKALLKYTDAPEHYSIEIVKASNSGATIEMEEKT